MPKIVRALYEGTAPDGRPIRFLTVLAKEPAAYMRLLWRDGVWSPVTVRVAPEPLDLAREVKEVWVSCVRIEP